MKKIFTPTVLLFIVCLLQIRLANSQCTPTITTNSSCIPALLTVNTGSLPLYINLRTDASNSPVTTLFTTWDQNITTVAPVSNPGDMFLDKNNNIYVSDPSNSKVLKFASGSTTGVVVAGGNGKGSNANQLNSPKGIYVDNSGNVYVVDQGNNRVQKWLAGANTGSTVAGGNGAGANANQLDGPGDVYLDASGNIFISDGNNRRVQKWLVGATTGVVVYNVNTMNANFLPSQLFIDASGVLYVCDVGNRGIWNNHGINYVGDVYSNPTGVTISANGNIYYSSTNYVNTTANNNGLFCLNTGSSIKAIASNMNNLNGIALDASGNFFTTNGTGVIKLSPTVSNTYNVNSIAQATFYADITYVGSCAFTSTNSGVFINSTPSLSNYTLSGPTSVISGQSYNYSLSAIVSSGGTQSSYNWALPSNWGGSSVTNSISVTPNNNDGSISVTAGNNCGISNSLSLAVKVNQLASNSVTATQTINGTTIYNNGSSIINTITPSGTSPVTGSITAKVNIDASVQSVNGQPYLQRHYDIEPATNASTATATVTLYYTQAEFTAYNTAASAAGLPLLPIDATDAANNKANLRINQFHGTGTAPGNYSGYTGAGAATVLITPTTVSYNSSAARWEVTFPVTGFSGFYASTSSNGILPVSLTTFTATLQNHQSILNWATATETNNKGFDVERSADAVTFAKIGYVTGHGTTTQQENYTYIDAQPLQGKNYYRLKQIDLDGHFTYSNIVEVSNVDGNNSLKVFPSPAKNSIAISTTGYSGMVQILDVAGHIVKTATITGNNTVLDISSLSKGNYFCKAGGATVLFVKE